MKELKHDLLTNKYTTVYCEEDFNYNAPCYFSVYITGYDYTVANCVGGVHFQNGPIKEVGVNGVNNEDVLAMVICRLEHFQNSEYACRENALAITKLEEALMWLRKRTMGREQRNVEGTHIV